MKAIRAISIGGLAGQAVTIPLVLSTGHIPWPGISFAGLCLVGLLAYVTGFARD